VYGNCTSSLNRYTCHCNDGYTGTNCDDIIDLCMSNPCVNGGCRPFVNSYKCLCTPGWTGRSCETNIDECLFNRCVHGRCEDRIDAYLCVCDKGWSGAYCDCVEEDLCALQPCRFGDCENTPDGFTCRCEDGYVGELCDTAVSTTMTTRAGPPRTYDCDQKNPCSAVNVAAGRLYFPHSDPTKYVHCMDTLECIVTSCPVNHVWDYDDEICVPA